MTDKAKYKRVLLKISGQSLCRPGGSGLHLSAIASLVDELAPVVQSGIQVGLVVGGGNILRGRQLAHSERIHRVTADHMGMLATVINALALRDVLASRNMPACVLAAMEMTAVCEPFTQRRALEHLEAGRLVILAGGTGNPFFTTDTCAALRASELDAELLLKATKVDGVFDADPETTPDAKKYRRLTYEKVLADKLGVMDLTAISLCMDNQIPIVVFQLDKAGNLLAAVSGQDVGTLITSQAGDSP